MPSNDRSTRELLEKLLNDEYERGLQDGITLGVQRSIDQLVKLRDDEPVSTSPAPAPAATPKKRTRNEGPKSAPRAGLKGSDGIEELNLNHRAYTGLMNNGFKTIEMARNLPDETFDYVENFGKGALDVLKSQLELAGFKRGPWITVKELLHPGGQTIDLVLDDKKITILSHDEATNTQRMRNLGFHDITIKRVNEAVAFHINGPARKAD